MIANLVLPTRRRRASGRPWPGMAGVLAFVVLALVSTQRVSAQTAAEDGATRQVTLFGVIATPGTTEIDPKLAKVEAQLRKLLPNHGFRLLDVQSKRLGAGQKVGCKLEDGFTVEATLTQPIDENGKVRLRCSVLKNDVEQLETQVTTPANQLFFCEKELVAGSRLLIGIGAR